MKLKQEDISSSVEIFGDTAEFDMIPHRAYKDGVWVAFEALGSVSCCGHIFSDTVFLRVVILLRFGPVEFEGS